jgi:hypothetical protein
MSRSHKRFEGEVSLKRSFSLAVLWGVLAACPALAQPTPAGPEAVVNSYLPDDQFQASVAIAADGGYLVVWTSSPNPFGGGTGQDGSGAGVFGRRFDAAGQPLGADFLINQTTAGDQDSPAVAGNADGFVVVWRSQASEDEPGRIFGRRYDAAGSPRGGEFPVSEVSEDPTAQQVAPRVALDTKGIATIVWESDSAATGFRQVALRRLNAAGSPQGPAVLVDTSAAAYTPAVAADGSGNLFVVWTRQEEDTGIFARRFDPAGLPLTDPFRVSAQPVSLDPDVSCSPAGACVVVWESLFTVRSVYVRRLPAGTDTGIGAPPEFRAWIAPFDTYSTIAPRVSCDAAGGFAVVWSDSALGVIAGSFDAAGRKRGPTFPIIPGGLRSLDEGKIAVASAADGDFVTVYTDAALELDREDSDIFSSRFLLPPRGADPCLFFADGRLSCDPLRDGKTELETPIDGAQPGDVPLLGDLDGDGRAELCLFRRGLFLCDELHNGTLSFQRGFGRPGDIPLLGDLNGDGRADPCVFRRGHFLCDTAHNGGFAEVKIAFGRAGDIPLLGDVNGDGADDPCVFRNGRFLCDIAHDGGGGEVLDRFGQAGDIPFLADFDHDGRADFCVYRQGVFLCDTAHDGGASAVAFGAPGAIPLLGNVDGI